MGRKKRSGLSRAGEQVSQQTLEQGLNTAKNSDESEFSRKHMGTSADMPNYDKAVIDPRKFTEYSLSPQSKDGKDKAVVYKRVFNYDQTNYQSLIDQIFKAIHNGTARLWQKRKTSRGTQYSFYVTVTGPNGVTGEVMAAFQIDNGATIPKLITNRVKTEK